MNIGDANSVASSLRIRLSTPGTGGTGWTARIQAVSEPAGRPLILSTNASAVMRRYAASDSARSRWVIYRLRAERCSTALSAISAIKTPSAAPRAVTASVSKDRVRCSGARPRYNTTPTRTKVVKRSRTTVIDTFLGGARLRFNGLSNPPPTTLPASHSFTSKHLWLGYCGVLRPYCGEGREPCRTPLAHRYEKRHPWCWGCRSRKVLPWENLRRRATCRNRTDDLRITSALLYHLS
jgi:hypothetical protein